MSEREKDRKSTKSDKGQSYERFHSEKGDKSKDKDKDKEKERSKDFQFFLVVF